MVAVTEPPSEPSSPGPPCAPDAAMVIVLTFGGTMKVCSAPVNPNVCVPCEMQTWSDAHEGSASLQSASVLHSTQMPATRVDVSPHTCLGAGPSALQSVPVAAGLSAGASAPSPQ